MSKRFKTFEVLSSRQKRRRLNNILENRLNVDEDSESSETDQEDIGDMNIGYDNDANIVNDELSDDNIDDDNENGDVQNTDDDDDAESQSSHEGDIDDDFDDFEAPAEIDDEDASRESSESEEQDEPDVNHQNVSVLQRRCLKNAFLSANINLTQGNILLRTLRQFPFNLNHLPKDSRTVVSTPTIVASTIVRHFAGGDYLHIGLKKTLIKKLESVPVNMMPDTINIDFSTDGVKMDKGADDFWPIQYRILNIADKRPIIAGIFQGKEKPSNPFDFFEEFIQEISEIHQEGGIIIRNQRLPLTIRCFIADAPARAFSLNHFGHSSANACSKCKVEGHRCNTPGFGGTMVFLDTEHELRTDIDYQNLLDEDHHKGRSPLSPILPLVTRVPFEPMHAVYLGNVKKLLLAHVGGEFGFRRLNGRKLKILDSRMKDLQLYCPSDFNRRPQVLSSFRKFKATEFRQFLLHIAPAVVKDIFEEDYYNHLMILHAVMRLLVSEETPRDMYTFCREGMKTYVSLCVELYGEQFLSYNVHSALHFVDDVEILGPCDTFSAFCYENNFQALRKLIRKPGLKLPQIYKRIAEREDYALTPVVSDTKIKLSQSHSDGPLPVNITANICQQFKKIEIGKNTISSSLRDSCFHLKNSEICIVKNIIQRGGDINLIVQCFLSKDDIYDVGIKSSAVNIYKCQNQESTLRVISLTDIKCKSYIMPEWSNVGGQEERILPDKWICASLLSPFLLPENIF